MPEKDYYLRPADQIGVADGLSPKEYEQALNDLLGDPNVPHAVKEEAISRGPAFFVRPHSGGGADIPRPYTPADLYQKQAEEARLRGAGKRGSE